MKAKRCIIKIDDEPIHPSKYYENIWVDSKFWVSSMFFSDDISYIQWKTNKLNDYEFRCESFEYNGYYLKLVDGHSKEITANNIIEWID